MAGYTTSTDKLIAGDRLFRDEKGVLIPAQLAADILKIDVEGSELNVLKGCKKNIKNVKVILIEILHHDSIKNYSKIDIFRFLKNNGFRLHSSLKFPFYGFEDRIYINNKFFFSE